MSKAEKRSIDPVSQKMLDVAEQQGVPTAWDRWEAMQPQCGFGSLGICCRICNMGPCRIDPFGEGTQTGVCGADADTIVARNLVRMIAAGAAAHSDHGRDVAHTVLMTARGEAQGYEIKDEVKLRALAAEYGIDIAGKDKAKLAEEVAEKAFSEFGQQHGELLFLARAPEKQRRNWRERNVVPRGIDREVVEVMHTTHMGVANDYKDVLRIGTKAALADGWGGSMIATDLQDVLFGAPQPIRARLNLSILKKDEVNIIVHGHEPILSEMIVVASRDPELLKLAKEKGANGITLGGICCTANEILMRHGIPIAGDFLQQELAILTGAVDAMVVDVQCIMPGLSSLASCFHTKLVTTSVKARFPENGAVEHIQFDEEHALDGAKRIVRAAIENFPNRKQDSVVIPDEKETSNLIAGFTAENTYHFLGGRYRATYRPLNNAIIEGRIRGLAGVVGCCNPNIKHNFAHVEMVKELLRHDVLVVQTGCSAIACAKAGMLAPEGAFKYAGKGLREVCEAVGIPPVLHLGACVDNSRILVALCNVVKEGGVGESIDEIPVAGAAPEWMSEKAVAIGFYVVASGVFTVFGTPMPVLGSEKVADYMTRGMEQDFGAAFAFEPDPIKAAQLMIEHINKKRADLKLRPMLNEPVAAADLAAVAR
ncbi:MAG: anaerobic carbon-monoxide dehydrogenase catalytic subunit [Dehalococcoidia bacterium]|nr:anaerobic carbon-monoxide dehydrogenase catalytic subunit [Dehalococcoidia bacterium]